MEIVLILAWGFPLRYQSSLQCKYNKEVCSLKGSSFYTNLPVAPENSLEENCTQIF